MRDTADLIHSLLVTRIVADLGIRQDPMSKIILRFNGGHAGPRHEDLESVRVKGPGGTEWEMAPHDPFEYRKVMNGYKIDRWSGGLILERYLNHDLEPGRYEVEVRFADGRVATRSRVLERNDALVAAYLERRSGIERNPAGSTVELDPSGQATFTWSTLASLDGPDAFYCVRVAEGFTWPYLDPEKAVYSAESYEASSRAMGLNLDSLTLPLKRGGEYTWFAELLDSDQPEEINIAIFMPSHRFVTQ